MMDRCDVNINCLEKLLAQNITGMKTDIEGIK